MVKKLYGIDLSACSNTNTPTDNIEAQEPVSSSLNTTEVLEEVINDKVTPTEGLYSETPELPKSAENLDKSLQVKTDPLKAEKEFTCKGVHDTSSLTTSPKESSDILEFSELSKNTQQIHKSKSFVNPNQSNSENIALEFQV